MKKIYAKDGDFHKEIEIEWIKHEERFLLTKRTVSGRSSWSHSMQFTENEMSILRKMFNES